MIGLRRAVSWLHTQLTALPEEEEVATRGAASPCLCPPAAYLGIPLFQVSVLGCPDPAVHDCLSVREERGHRFRLVYCSGGVRSSGQGGGDTGCGGAVTALVLQLIDDVLDFTVF